MTEYSFCPFNFIVAFFCFVLFCFVLFFFFRFYFSVSDSFLSRSLAEGSLGASLSLANLLVYYVTIT